MKNRTLEQQPTTKNINNLVHTSIFKQETQCKDYAQDWRQAILLFEHFLALKGKPVTNLFLYNLECSEAFLTYLGCPKFQTTDRISILRHTSTWTPLSVCVAALKAHNLVL